MLAINTAENGTRMPEFNVREPETWDLGRWKQSLSTHYKGDYDEWSTIPCASKSDTDDHDDGWTITANNLASKLDDTAPCASEKEKIDQDDDAWSITANPPESDLDDDAPRASESGIDGHDDAWSITANASESDLEDTTWWSEDPYHEVLHSFSNTGLYPSPSYDPYEEVFSW